MAVTSPYELHAKIFKALADANRLRILEILSCGERCACEIQTYFEFSQPTLSHHMKILIESGLVSCRKEGLWSYYDLNGAKAQELMTYFKHLISDTADCPCKLIPNTSVCISNINQPE